jgi:hypothetical protein
VLGIVGLALAYRVVGQFANGTTVLVSRERIRIEKSPIAIQRVRTFAADGRADSASSAGPSGARSHGAMTEPDVAR